jgi:hypothetical protein
MEQHNIFSQIQSLHKQAMDLAKAAAVDRLRGVTDQAFEQETKAAASIVNTLGAKPTRSVLRSISSD